MAVGCGDDDDDDTGGGGNGTMMDGGTGNGDGGNGGGGDDGGTNGGGDDGGTNGGGDDGGTDPANAFVRISHLISDAPAVQVCVYPTGSDTAIPLTPAEGLAYKSSTGFAAVPETITGAGYVIPHEDGFACPDTAAAAETASVLTLMIEDATLGPDDVVTIAAVGFLDPESLGDICGDANDEGCEADGPEAATLQAWPSNFAPDMAGNFILNVAHGIPNAPAVTVCLDPDGDGEMDVMDLLGDDSLAYTQTGVIQAPPLDDAAVVTVEPKALGCDGTTALVSYTGDTAVFDADQANTIFAVGQFTVTEGAAAPDFVVEANTAPE